MNRAPGESFDHHSESFAATWREQAGKLRAGCPVAHTPAHGGYTVVTRFADATTVLRDSGGFSAARHVPGVGVAGGVTIPRNPVRMGMMEMDPPEHTQYRKALTPWFSARAVEASLPRLQTLVDWSLDRVCETGRMDVVDDLSHVLPGIVTLDVLGLPLDRYGWYGDALGGAAYYEPGSERGLRAVLADLGTIVAAARDDPSMASPLLRRLIGEPAAGDGFEDAMIVELLFMLLNGGFDTSSALIAHMLMHLDTHPSDRARLQADRALVPLAIDELLRFYSPATGVARTLTRDTVVGDSALPAGERILVLLGSANSDGAKFEQADEFRVDRFPNPHISFGSGVHRCIGSFLARTEMVVLLIAILDRLPDLHVDRAGVLAHRTAPLVHGYRQVPVYFTPSPQVLAPTADGLPSAEVAEPRAMAVSE